MGKQNELGNGDADLELQMPSPPNYEGSSDEQQEPLLQDELNLAAPSTETTGAPGPGTYASAGLLQVGQGRDPFKCLITNQPDLDAIRRQVNQELSLVMPDHEVASFTIKDEQDPIVDRFGMIITPSTWLKLYSKVHTVGLKIKRTSASEIARRRRAWTIVLTFIFGGCLFLYLVCIAVAYLGNSGEGSLSISFDKGLEPGAKGIIQCSNNKPSIQITGNVEY